MASRCLVSKGKEHEQVELDSPTPHKGDIRKLIYTKIDNLDVLISASADRTIKLWEPKTNNNGKGNKCFQTMIGHGGSIIDMVYIEKVELLVTSSTDKSMRIWHIDRARQLLLYPWFIEFQKVCDFLSSNMNPSIFEQSVWLQCFDVKEGESLQIYTGDNEGSIYIFEA
mmetsp:Transcript_97639/g.134324  ORF Transcript_97639/g.134324 Transcript_97639/m.134324 type:complete len:169 (-) Transcript_97639:1723-2229(-)